MNAADGRRRTLVRPDTYVSLPRSSVVAVILDGSTVSGLAWPAVDRAFERKGVKLNGGGPAPPWGWVPRPQDWPQATFCLMPWSDPQSPPGSVMGSLTPRRAPEAWATPAG